jgi:hypothetical protein
MSRMRIRLNGLQRIGVVGSILWAIGAPIYMDDIAEKKALATFSWVYKLCRDMQDARIASGLPIDHSRDCLKEAEVMSDSEPRYNLTPKGGVNVILVVFIPILLGWLAAYALVALGRWIRAGF